MMTFQKQAIDNTIEKLLKGEDYRNEVINAINANFFDFTISFLKSCVQLYD